MKIGLILFLIKKDLIHPRIIKNWQQRNKNEKFTNTDIQNTLGDSLHPARMFLASAIIVVIAFALFLGIWLENNSETIKSVLIGLTMGIVYFLTGSKLMSKNKFAVDLNILFNKGFNGTYTFHLPFENQKAQAESILSDLAVAFNDLEITLGIGDPETVKVRERFEKAHAIFLKFGLCDERQSYYFPSHGKDIKSTGTTSN